MKEIILTQGKVAFVDDEDFEYLSQWKWCAVKGRSTYYASRTSYETGVQLHIKMHREIFRLKPYKDEPIVVDHKDHNGLNNQKENLRKCTPLLNQANKTKIQRKSVSSRYKGVVKHTHSYQARITYKDTTYKLGFYKDEVNAARAYDQKAREFFGEFALLNFPNESIPPVNKITKSHASSKSNANKIAKNILGLKGVSKIRNHYISRITYQGKTHHLGRYDTAEQASQAYNKKAEELFKDYF